MYGNIMHIAYVNWLEEHGVPVPVPPGPTPVPPGPTPEPSPYPHDWVLLRFADPNADPTGHGNLVHWEKKTDSAYNDWYLKLGARIDSNTFYITLIEMGFTTFLGLDIIKDSDNVIISGNIKETLGITGQEDTDNFIEAIIESGGVLSRGSTGKYESDGTIDKITIHCMSGEVYPGQLVGAEIIEDLAKTFRESVSQATTVSISGNIGNMVINKSDMDIFLTDAFKKPIEFNDTFLNSVFIPFVELPDGTTGTVSIKDIEGTMNYEIKFVVPWEYVPDFQWKPELSLDDEFTIIDEDWTYSYWNLECGLFQNCKGLTSIRSNLFNSIKDASYMFRDCIALTAIPDNSFNSVTDALAMFDGCIALTVIPDNSFNSVTDAFLMFGSCRALTAIPGNSFNSVTNADFMFQYCISVSNGALALYTYFAESGNVSDGNHSETFYNCGKDTSSGLNDLMQIPSSWGGLAEG